MQKPDSALWRSPFSPWRRNFHTTSRQFGFPYPSLPICTISTVFAAATVRISGHRKLTSVYEKLFHSSAQKKIFTFYWIFFCTNFPPHSSHFASQLKRSYKKKQKLKEIPQEFSSSRHHLFQSSRSPWNFWLSIMRKWCKEQKRKKGGMIDDISRCFREGGELSVWRQFSFILALGKLVFFGTCHSIDGALLEAMGQKIVSTLIIHGQSVLGGWICNGAFELKIVGRCTNLLNMCFHHRWKSNREC